MFCFKKGGTQMTEDITAILERPTCSVEELGRILGVSKNPAYDAVKRVISHRFALGVAFAS